MRDTYGLSLGVVADLVHRSKMHVSRRVRLVSDPALRTTVSSGHLAVSSAERLLRVPEEAHAALVQRAVVEKWTPDQAEEAVRGPPTVTTGYASPPEAPPTPDLLPAPSLSFGALLHRLRADVPVLERESERLGEEEQTELASWAQRLRRAVGGQP